MKIVLSLALITLVVIGVFIIPSIMPSYAGHGVQPIKRIEETDSSFTWTPGWESQKNANASGGTWKVSRIPGSKVTVSFAGTGVVLYYTKSPEGGIATIELDGESYTFIDMYSPIPESRIKRTIASGLKNTRHTLVVTVSRVKQLSSSNSFVVVDAVDIVLV